MHIKVTHDNVFAGFANFAQALGRQGLKIGVQTLNQVGVDARKEIIKAEARETGLSTRILGRALHETKASVEVPQYVITSAGGEISLKYFGAKETREGVSAKPWGKRVVFPGTFMKAGSFAQERVTVQRWNGQVFRRTGAQTGNLRPNSKRRMDEFEKVTSGVVIPREMIRGEPLKAFETMASQLEGVVLRRLGQLAP